MTTSRRPGTASRSAEEQVEPRKRGSDLFWGIVEPLLASGDLERDTIMGRPCVRRGGEFVATSHSKTGHLIVRIDADRVAELIEEGVGVPFAPAGRVFREWLDVAEFDETRWRALINEAASRH